MIRVHHLTKAFGNKVALRGINLHVAEGESLVIFGPNGAGKTTLIRILASLSRPTSGSVSIGGLDLATHAEGIRRYLGVVSHAPLLYDSLTAEENLRFFARLYGMTAPQARITAMLERVGLNQRRGDLVRTFSRGMTQRLAIARALLHDPLVLLLDEPDTGLDPQAAEMLHDLLAQLSGRPGIRKGDPLSSPQGAAVAPDRRGGGGHGVTAPTDLLPHRLKEPRRTIVTITHSLERGLALADRVAILANGRLAFEAEASGLTAVEFRPLYDHYCAASRRNGRKVGGGR